ncbi:MULTISPECIES: heme ABC transporter substrate-binding protein IsdE [Peptoniphilus]|uniref:High-affinity heme uptake system protein IsdE n=2 Tax=Peptoniphilus TaxID=162289 RepID=A0ABU7X7B6_9FIRM|nr:MULTISPECIES: heme ABC transporter substrate-binding protein IsdE [Peptoniphilus]MDU1023149.1 heme ABC transporter substrate-binding protein IsdE [Peptoniphilus harei]MDU1662795.1 heme ABC transporter substrate-binding protein IsdE [Peptoniphilus harei]MDU2373258.1 heme ABC transporter substrate-binding protein IsdE [Peptoniphilus harei]MDU4046582.1 heme ABC transporter substrate-binding protein IsdE [Peptoniphilus harei]MDU5467038.1 heme ABC transporter substrate-binding protein IsdE [Pept
MNRIKKILAILLASLLLTSCVSQKSGKKANNGELRIAATSMATVYIMEKLNVDLVAVPNSEIDPMPERYKDVPKVGMAMTPDIEKLKQINPDYVFSPVSLISDLLPKYKAADLDYGFLNLNNTDGMYKSIEDLGKLLNRKKEAKELIDDYKKFIDDYKEKHKDKKAPRVLILMGLPGSYVVATENSYAGSLVKLAGAENVYEGTNQQFITINTEDMLKKDPDIILRTAHALPDDVMEMFKKDFAENDIWKHFRAVKEGKVYDLDYKKFGMSAKFNYKEALNDLDKLFYGKDSNEIGNTGDKTNEEK